MILQGGGCLVIARPSSAWWLSQLQVASPGPWGIRSSGRPASRPGIQHHEGFTARDAHPTRSLALGLAGMPHWLSKGTPALSGFMTSEVIDGLAESRPLAARFLRVVEEVRSRLSDAPGRARSEFKDVPNSPSVQALASWSQLDVWPVLPDPASVGGNDEDVERALFAPLVAAYDQACADLDELERAANEEHREVGQRSGLSLAGLRDWFNDLSIRLRELQVDVRSTCANDERAMAEADHQEIGKLRSAIVDERSALIGRFASPLASTWWRDTPDAVDLDLGTGSIVFGGASRAGDPMFVPTRGNLFIVGERSPSRSVAFTLMVKLLLSRPPGDARVRFVDPALGGQSLGPLFELMANPELGGRVAASDSYQIGETIEFCRHRAVSITQQALRGRLLDIDEFNATERRTEHYLYLVGFAVGDAWSLRDIETVAQLAELGPAAGVSVVATVEAVSDTARARAVERLLSVADSTVIGDVSVNGTTASGVLRSQSIDLDVIADSDPRVARTLSRLTLAAGSTLGPAVDLADLDVREAGATSEEGISIPVGIGSNRAVEVSFGDDPVHGLVVGGTGSGKTTLLHTLIHTAAKKYSPDELELWLIDLKEGVEFRQYADDGDVVGLPHARVVACASDPHFALASLQALVEEGKARAGAFRRAGVSKFAAFRAQSSGPLPRVLCILDECHLLLSHPKLGAQAWRELEWLTKEGRAFGIHVLLATQSLAGMGVLAGQPASVWRQIALRIALRCSPADAELVFGEKNQSAVGLAPRGDAVLNASHGAPGADVRFQVAHIPDGEAAELRAGIAARNPRPGNQTTFVGDERPLWTPQQQDQIAHQQVTLGRSLTLEPYVAVGFTEPWRVGVFGPREGTAAALSVAAIELGSASGGVFVLCPDDEDLQFAEQIRERFPYAEVLRAVEQFGDCFEPDRPVVGFSLHRIRSESAAKPKDHPIAQILEACSRNAQPFIGAWSTRQAPVAQLGLMSASKLPFDVEVDAAGGEVGALRGRVTYAQSTGIFAEPKLFVPWENPLEMVRGDGR